MRNHFNRQLLLLQKGLIEMCQLCSETIETLNQAFLFQEKQTLQELKIQCMEMEEMNQELSALCARLLLRQAPVAGDLSLIFLVQQTILDLKRIGQQSMEIALLLPSLSGKKKMEPPQMEELIEKASQMVLESAEACIREDKEMAQCVLRQEDTVDLLLMKVKKSLIRLLKEKPDEGEYALDLLLAAKYLERMADHAAHMAGVLQE